jgi:hypothetical protein
MMTAVLNFAAAGTSMFSEFCGALEINGCSLIAIFRNACFLIAVETMPVFLGKSVFFKNGNF